MSYHWTDKILHYVIFQNEILVPAIPRVKLAKFSAKLVANFRRSLEGDFRASFAGENRQKHFPPKLHRKFHHQRVQVSLSGCHFLLCSWGTPFAQSFLEYPVTSLNKEVRPFFLSDNSIWSFPSVSSISDYSIWRS